MKITLPFQRLAFKISVPIALITLVMIEIVIRVFLNAHINDMRSEIQQRLKETAAFAANAISADEHQTALYSHSDSIRVIVQTSIKDKWNSLRKQIDFREHWYTLIPLQGTKVIFGVMSHEVSFTGDTHYFRDSSAYQTFMKCLDSKKPQFTDIYSDDNGTWISGFAPIISNTGKSVAAVEVDLTYSQYLARENELHRFAWYIRIISIVASILFAHIIGFVIANPIHSLSDASKQIASNNFEGSVKIPYALDKIPDELTVLIKNFNTMSSKLNSTLTELRDAKSKLENLDYAKSVFLQFIAHELRTPLNGLNNLSLIPLLQDLEPDTIEVLDAATNSAERLKKFTLAAEQYINVLNHTPKQSEISYDLQELLPAVLDEYKLRLLECGKTFSPQIQCNECILTIPHEIVENILRIVLDNALKFSKSKVECVCITLGNKVCISVSDDGIGFNPEFSSQIFEPFFITDILHHSHGNGVNLATVKVLVEHYNGAIIAFSNGDNTGATIMIDLPINGKLKLTASENQSYLCPLTNTVIFPSNL